MKSRDERLTLISDILLSVRLIKMYAWEKVYIQKANAIRALEMAPLFWLNILDGVLDSIFSASSSVVSPCLHHTA